MPRAYGWRDGRIALTTGLLALLDDDELTAAIAHEMGHMASGTLPVARYGLNGCASALDPEVQADALGCDILQRSGVPTSAMISMLRKMQRSATLPLSCKEQMQQRISRLAGTADTAAPATFRTIREN